MRFMLFAGLMGGTDSSLLMPPQLCCIGANDPDARNKDAAHLHNAVTGGAYVDPEKGTSHHPSFAGDHNRNPVLPSANGGSSDPDRERFAAPQPERGHNGSRRGAD